MPNGRPSGARAIPSLHSKYALASNDIVKDGGVLNAGKVDGHEWQAWGERGFDL